MFDFFSQLYGIAPEVIAQRKAKLFERFGIDKFAEVKVANLSTGMKQKTSLVVSLVHDPEFVIFDEPTNGLDVLTARTVTDYLLELREQGKTIILSTHIFSLVERLCDRVGIIIDGRLVACGSLQEVCKYGMTKDCGLLVNSSRGIIYASSDEHFAEIAGNKARELQQEMAIELDKISR